MRTALTENGSLDKKPRMGVLGLLAFVGAVLLAGAASAGIEEARAKYGEFKKELTALTEAQAQNDEAAFKQHQKSLQASISEALRLFAESRRPLRQDAAGLNDYAELLSYTGRYNQAAEVLKQLVAIDPKNPEAALRLGKALSSLGPSRSRDAEQALRDALALSSSPEQQSQVYLAFGDLYRREGLFDLARGNVDQALGLTPDNKGAHLAHAMLEVRLGRLAAGEKELTAQEPLSADLNQYLAPLLREALDGFSDDRRWAPDTAEDHLAYAKLLVRAGRVQECLGPLERAVKLDSNNYVTWNLLGSISQYAGNTARAREAYTRSLALRPDDARTQEALRSLDTPPSADAQAGAGSATP